MRGSKRINLGGWQVRPLTLRLEETGRRSTKERVNTMNVGSKKVRPAKSNAAKCNPTGASRGASKTSGHFRQVVQVFISFIFALSRSPLHCSRYFQHQRSTKGGFTELTGHNIYVDVGLSGARSGHRSRSPLPTSTSPFAVQSECAPQASPPVSFRAPPSFRPSEPQSTAHLDQSLRGAI